MGMLHCMADVREQLQALSRREAIVVAVLCDRYAADQFHHEVRTPQAQGLQPLGFALRVPHIEDPGDVGMVHQCQRLPLGLEADQTVSGVHPRLDDFERDLATHRFVLLGHENQPHPSGPR
jgi:hypothetical protein